MRTKVICTIGPSTESEEVLEKLVLNGMDIARMNFSHGDHAEQERKIDLVRKLSEKHGKKIQILCDLQGPKIRTNNSKTVTVKDGDFLTLCSSVCEDVKPDEIMIDDPYLHGDVKPGDEILIDDGIIELEVLGIDHHKIRCLVINGGDIYPRKGVNLPLTTTTTSSLTEKDKRDLEFSLTKDPDWIAISFVQSAADVLELKELMGESKAKVMCKIERANAIENINEIIAEADGIMVARGDLGVEIPIEKLPIIQKQLIKKCNHADKAVVTATQMLASMTKIPFPSRAEVTDIANAVIDGTDAVMMSNETAVGQYPLESLQTMVKVAKYTEDHLFHRENPLNR